VESEARIDLNRQGDGSNTDVTRMIEIRSYIANKRNAVLPLSFLTHPPIHVEYLRSGGADIRIFTSRGASFRVSFSKRSP